MLHKVILATSPIYKNLYQYCCYKVVLPKSRDFSGELLFVPQSGIEPESKS